ncbi:MAG: response regulator, partial [Lachnospiraceae bacterium]
KSGRYQLCYNITIVAVFLICFAFIFFSGGGYYGAMPFFFIFAVVFTIYMLEGKRAIVMAGAELLFYTCLCLLAYFFPHLVSVIDTEFYKLIEILTGFWAVSLILGITMYQQFGMYHEQQRKLEEGKKEALQVSEAKSNFLANMSHEIRTPINVMLGMNEMILRECDSGQIREYGKNIQNAGKTLLLLINNILDVSRIEAGKLDVTVESYQIANLIDELSIIGSELTGRKGLTFQTEADEALPAVLTGDQIHIKQVAVNFLSNAAKYTKQGGVTLQVSGRQGEQPDSILLCISVTDTGIGIKEGQIPILFDAFTRGDQTVNRCIEGTGLGLTIAKELTELMGGHIHVKSRWGKGSVFSVEIPQKVVNSTPLCLQQHVEFEDSKNPKAGFIAPEAAILVADDNRENLQVIRLLLSRTMIRVDTVDSGRKVIEAVRCMRYDVILMDYMMPEMDGMETLKHLRELADFDTPVVALTANVVSGVREKLLRAGFCKYLSKPVRWYDLENVLRELLPKELVTENRAAEGAVLSDSLKDELAAQLGPYGIQPEDGLRYLSGDIRQYWKLAGFFTENYSMGRSEVCRLAAEENWESLKYCIHSLKSKAKAIGANDLSQTAAKLERLCAEGESPHMEAALPLLYYEWERAEEGMRFFYIRLGELIPKEERAPDLYPNDLEDLMKLLNYHRHPDALDALDHMIAKAKEPELAACLREIWEKVEEVEFEQAQQMLLDIMGGDGDGQ